MRKLCILSLLFFLCQTIHAQIAAWDFFGETSTATSAAEIFANLDASNLMTRGAGAVSSSASNSFRTTGFKNDGIATSNTDYFQFTLSANPGYTLSLAAIDAKFGGTASFFAAPGVTSQFAYSFDGVNFILIGNAATSTSLSMAQINLSGIAALQNIADGVTVTFRYYASGQTTSGGWGFTSGTAGQYGLAVGGSVTPVAAANTITTGALSNTLFCTGQANPVSGDIPYTSSGNYNTTFTAWLSDGNGSFVSPVSIGTATVTGSNPSGNMTLTIPANASSGSGYKIRIDAANPLVIGTESLSFEMINGAVNVTGLTAASSSAGAVLTWTNPLNCYDEIMIVAKAGSSITAMPSGNGSAYIASLDFNGTGSLFDGGKIVYQGTTSGQTITGLISGNTYYFKLFTRKGSRWSDGVETSMVFRNVPAPGDILINQFSPDYNNTADEYIELINTTNKVFDLSLLAIKYQSGSGTNGNAGGNLTGTLLPHSFWLLSPNSNITVGVTNNLSRDGAITSGFAASGQLALARLNDNVVIDALGYGTITGGIYFENTPSQAPPANGGLRRVTDGYDNNNNSTDFTTVINTRINLRNSANISLPVRLENIELVKQDNGILIGFRNLTESHVDSYFIEHAQNGKTFTAIAEIKAKKNDEGPADYRYVDMHPFDGENLYRIKAIEFSGNIIYSGISRLNIYDDQTSISLYPNPATGDDIVLKIQNLANGNYQIKIRNINGLTVFESSLKHKGGVLSERLQTGKLSPGLYIIEVSGIQVIQKKFIVQ